ncbi:Protein transport protein yif1 [Binucleata daphniae]
MSSHLSKSVMNVGKDYVNKGLTAVDTKHLHPYFQINNSIVINKIFLIVFPFKTDWSTKSKINRPDMYIPLMAFLTYILLSGVQNMYTPEKMSLIFTRCLFYEICFVSLVKLVAYFMDILEIGYIDFFCYSGYKFVVILLKNMVRFKYVKIVWQIYLYCAFFFFLSRSLKSAVVGDSGYEKRKVYFLFITVFLEVFLVFLLA